MFTPNDLKLVKDILLDQPKYYHMYFRLKSNGKKRMIIAPNDEYKLLQKKLNYWLRRYGGFKIHHSAYAWEYGKRREDCAKLHVDKPDQCEVDITDYFTHITEGHLYGLLSYNEHIPVLLNILNIDLEQLIQILTISDRGKRFLPQGFCTSPYIANAVRYDIDIKMSEYCSGKKYAYSTFGDNIYVSGEFKGSDPRGFIFPLLKRYGFKANMKKSRIKRSSQRQDVVGIVVNKKLSIPKEYVHNLIQSVLDKAEDIAVILGKLNILRSSENKRNYNFVNKLIGYKYGTQIH